MKYNLFKAINANVLYEYKGSYKKKAISRLLVISRKFQVK